MAHLHRVQCGAYTLHRRIEPRLQRLLQRFLVLAHIEIQLLILRLVRRGCGIKERPAEEQLYVVTADLGYRCVVKPF